jgi:hypothetical protein
MLKLKRANLEMKKQSLLETSDNSDNGEKKVYNPDDLLDTPIRSSNSLAKNYKAIVNDAMSAKSAGSDGTTVVAWSDVGYKPKKGEEPA